jgi:uncharacterized protein (DUF1330 family)
MPAATCGPEKDLGRLPPAYVVIPILKINDAAAFKAGALASNGARYVVRSAKFTSLDGNPSDRLAILAFDSVEKAQAWYNSPAQKEINAARLNSTNSLAFVVEGFAN